MIVYVGYVMGDCAQALFMSLDKEKVEQKLKDVLGRTWTEEYNLTDNVIELDCD